MLATIPRELFKPENLILQSDHIHAPGLVGAYSFGAGGHADFIKDLSGLGNDGVGNSVDSPGSHPYTAVVDTVGTCIDTGADPVDGRYDLPNGSLWPNGVNIDLTCIFLVKPEAGDEWSSLLGMGLSGDELLVGIDETPGNFHGHNYTGSTEDAALTPFPESEWTWGGYTRDSSGNYQWFVNGNGADFGSGGAINFSNALRMILGDDRAPGSANEAYTGRISWMSIWNHVLPAGAMSELHANPWDMWTPRSRLPEVVAVGGSVPIPVAMSSYRRRRA